MNFMESLKIAFHSILAHKLRSTLTMLGIIIGVGSIITVVAIGRGGEAVLKSQLVGPDNKTVSVSYTPNMDELFQSEITFNPTITDEDLFELKKIDGLRQVLITNSETESFPLKNKSELMNIVGLEGNFFAVNEVSIIEGRLIQNTDVEYGKNVVMINKKAKKNFFDDTSALGKIIEVRSQPLQVIGVFDSKKSSIGEESAEIYIPLTLWSTIYGEDEVQNISLQAKEVDNLAIIGKKAVRILNKRKPAEASGKYEVVNLKQIQEGISQVTKVMTYIIGGIAGISLIVGGIGVINIMLVSVAERTREIGIRKALGASRGKILLQFLIEAMILTSLGGVIGIMLGYAGANIVSILANWPPLVSIDVVIGGVLFSMILGIVCGLIPANMAAKLDPIEALRYE